MLTPSSNALLPWDLISRISDSSINTPSDSRQLLKTPFLKCSPSSISLPFSSINNSNHYFSTESYLKASLLKSIFYHMWYCSLYLKGDTCLLSTNLIPLVHLSCKFLKQINFIFLCLFQFLSFFFQDQRISK